MKMPWTQEQVDALNARQKSGEVHPYTCGNRKDIQKTHADGEGVLVATVNGWMCPYCDYRQDWAHDVDTAPKVPVITEHKDLAVLKMMTDVTVGGKIVLPSGLVIPEPPPGYEWNIDNGIVRLFTKNCLLPKN